VCKPVDLGTHRGTILNHILKKQDQRVHTGFIWLRIGTCSWLLWIW